MEGAARCQSGSLSVLTRINKTFNWDFLGAIWRGNHRDAPRLWLSGEFTFLPANFGAGAKAADVFSAPPKNPKDDVFLHAGEDVRQRRAAI